MEHNLKTLEKAMESFSRGYSYLDVIKEFKAIKEELQNRLSKLENSPYDIAIRGFINEVLGA